MKMVRAIIRPEKEVPVAAALANGGFPAMTKWDVLGRGKQQGVQVGDHFYDELAKCIFMVVVEDDQVTGRCGLHPGGSDHGLSGRRTGLRDQRGIRLYPPHRRGRPVTRTQGRLSRTRR